MDLVVIIMQVMLYIEQLLQDQMFLRMGNLKQGIRLGFS